MPNLPQEWINSKRADMLANGNPTLAALEQAKKAAVKAAEIAAAARGAANTAKADALSAHRLLADPPALVRA